tara:strand:+ start:8126 stop:9250 length:1125 start_codon:yes stop_codon:yes gene_type:complete
MNVLYIFGFQYSLKLWKKTGALEREFKFFEKLSEVENIKFTLVTYGDLRDIHLLDKDNVSVIPIFSIFEKTNSKILTFIFSLMLPFKVRKNLKHIDLIKTNQLTGCWVGILFKILLKKPLFLRTGYDAYLFSKEEKKNYFKKLFFYQLTKIALKTSDIYSVTSNSDYKFISENYNFTKSKLIYRPNWVLQKSDIKNVSSRTKNFLSVGRLESQKNYPYLIQCLSNSGLNIDILGDGSEKENLVKLANENNVNVNFLRQISYFELDQLFQNYKFFLLPSKFEGNPKVLLEAMSNGCIPIASNISNHEEIIINGENGFLFSLNNSKNLPNIIESLNDEEYCNVLSKNAIESVTRKNSFYTSVTQEIKDYRELTNLF